MKLMTLLMCKSVNFYITYIKDRNSKHEIREIMIHKITSFVSKHDYVYIDF